MSSLRLKDELKGLMLPYLELGFDQNATINWSGENFVTVTELQTLKHQCGYGRPLCAFLISTRQLTHHVLDGEPFSLKWTTT